MRLVRIGTASVSVKVGDFSGNAVRLQAAIEEAKRQQVHLLVTPELGISGYSLEDRVFWPDITRHSWHTLEELAQHCTGISVFLGLPVRIDAMNYNAAALVSDGKIRGLILKRYLPSYSIFYEGRNWAAWSGGVTQVNGYPAGDLVFQLPFGNVSAEICEDLWSATSPGYQRVLSGAEIICNLSASPFTPLKNEERKRLVQEAALRMKAVYAYANLLGCDNSRLVFAGGGIIATPEALVSDAPRLSKAYWTLDSAVVDMNDLSRIRSENTTWRQDTAVEQINGVNQLIDARDYEFIPAPVSAYAKQLPKSFFMPDDAGDNHTHIRDQHMQELFDALVLGMRDYFEKVGAFKRFLVALSGGRDSALCLMIAVEAAKALKGGTNQDGYADMVHTVYLPNKAFSSSGTEHAARAMAEELGVPFRVVSIHEETDVAFEKAVELAEGEKNVTALARQNLQARVRGAMMLNWANNSGGLLLVTSNLSEAAVGYTTTGGDNEGGYSPINNVPKTLVSELLAYLAKRYTLASIQQVLDIPPSAELAPDQQDEADLMPYVVLDDLLYLYARKRLSLADCWKLICLRHPDYDGEQLRVWAEDFARRFSQNQWKRDQHPVAMKVMDLDLDPKSGFRFPVTQSIQYELDELKDATLE